MTGHRITYDVLPNGCYSATCACGKRKDSTSTDVLSAWGPAHVVREYELEQRH